MKLRELKPAAGSKKAPKRVGRGTGSGSGKNAEKSEEGQNARSDSGVRPRLEGGQMSLYRRLSRRGFTNIFAKQYISINADRLNTSKNGTKVAPEVLLERRVINEVEDGAKVLGNGTLEKSLAVKRCKLSKSVTEKIEAAEGKVEVI